MVKERIVIKFPERISIGNHVGINEFCWLSGEGGIEIGDMTRIGPRTSIISFTREHKNKEIPIKLQGKIQKKVIIGSNVLTGNNVSILAGVKIGEGCVIGPGSVVTKDVPPFSVVAGVPAKIIRKR